jgi:hypothetical protein
VEISALAKRMAVDSELIQDRRKGLRTYRDAILGGDCVQFVLDNVNVANEEEATQVSLILIQAGMLSVLRGAVDDFESIILKLVRVEPIPGSQPLKSSAQSSASFAAPSPKPAAAAAASGGLVPLSPLSASGTSFGHSKPVRAETEMSLRHTTRSPFRGSFAEDGAADDQHLSTSVSSSALLEFEVNDMSDPLLSMRQHPTNAEVSGGPTAKSLNKMVINMESSDRFEWLYVAHDKTYHPNRTFYLVLEWTSCTGSAVHDFAQLISRKAKACNLDMIQIPLNFYQRSDPFFLPVEIPFDVPTLAEEECEAFQSAILKFCNFVPMQASSFEWVHATGSAFVTVSDHRWFQWYFNSLLIERDKGVAVEVKKLLHYFQSTVQKFQRAFCGDSSAFEVAGAEPTNDGGEKKPTTNNDDLIKVLSLCNPHYRPKLEALAVSAGLCSGEMFQKKKKN